jgi:O-antigen biosynthesis protein
MNKGDIITVCSIGRKIELSLQGLPHYEESRFLVINLEDDSLLRETILKWNPNVFVSFGDNWGDFPTLSKAPWDIASRWLHFDEGAPLDTVARQVIYCYLNALAPQRHPLVSIFTPSYKSGSKILRPFSSLLKQSYSNWEWIIVDDTEDYSNWQSLERLANMDHRIKPFRPMRRSGRIGELKKWACGLASGSILVELDHDDELTSYCLSSIVEAFSNNNDIGMAYTDDAEVYIKTGDSHIYPEGWGFGYGKYETVVYEGKEYMVGITPPINEITIRHIVGVPNHVRAWRTKTYHAIGGHNPNLHVADDYELILRTWLYSHIHYIPIFGYIQYRNEDGNTTFSRNAEIQRLVRYIQETYEPLIQARLAKGVPLDL